VTRNELKELNELHKRLARAGGLRSGLCPADRARLERLENVAALASNALAACQAQHIALGILPSAVSFPILPEIRAPFCLAFSRFTLPAFGLFLESIH